VEVEPELLRIFKMALLVFPILVAVAVVAFTMAKAALEVRVS
jgi:hypothetical protein